MKKLLASLVLVSGVTFASSGSYAQVPAATPETTTAPPTACAVRASEKKLAGAALNSFMKKCEREAAQSSCDETAKEKKLSGAARTSFTKKCVRDAAGK